MISLRFISGLTRSGVLAFILSLLAVSFITHPSLAANHAHTRGHDLIGTGSMYYLVPLDQPTRGVTYESSSFEGQPWDDLRLAASSGDGTTDRPAGTPIRLVLQPTGKYTMQMQGSNKQGFTFINAGSSGVWLDQADNARQWDITPTATGGYFISYDSDTTPTQKIYLSYDTTNNAWLSVNTVTSRQNPTTWDLIATYTTPTNPVPPTTAPATPVPTNYEQTAPAQPVPGSSPEQPAPGQSTPDQSTPPQTAWAPQA